MDDLEQKALEVVQNEPLEKELAKLIREEFNISNRRQIQFVIEYIKTNHAVNAYRSVYGQHLSYGGASVTAHRILARIDISKLLNYGGHGVDKMFEAMDKLFEEDPANYMKYQTKLRNLDTSKVELSGKIETYQIEFTTDKVDDE